MKCRRGEKFLASLFLASLPLQLSRHFWPSFAYLWGLPVDYLAPTIYLSSLFLLAWGGWVIFCRRRFPLAGSFFLLLSINIIFARQKMAALWGWLNFSQLLLLLWLAGPCRGWLKKKLPFWFSFWLLLEAGLSLGQVWRQASLGGFFWWLGERSFSLATPGIAKLKLAGQLWLRPYGTFPHPNALAGFALVGLGFLLGQRRRSPWCWLGILAAGLIIILTASHLVLGLSGLLLCFYLPASVRWGLLLFLPLLTYLPWSVNSWGRRWHLFLLASRIWRHHFFFGVGWNNFLFFLPHLWSANWGRLWLQPVHNVYLLWLSQTGLLGGVWALKQLWHRWRWQPLFLLIALSGLGDHYWLTSQQNLLLLGLVLAVVGRKA